MLELHNARDHEYHDIALITRSHVCRQETDQRKGRSGLEIGAFLSRELALF